MSKDFSFQMAQALRADHCDRKHEPNHTCVGEVTIKRGSVCLDCPLCGKGEEIPGFNAYADSTLRNIFNAAGVTWDNLDMQAKIAAIRVFQIGK